MSICATRSFEYIAGDDIRLAFAVTDLEGVPADITSCDLRVVISDVETHEAILSTEGGSPIGPLVATLTDPEHGLFEVTSAGNHTENLLGTYEWQAKVDNDAGDPETATVGHGFISFARSLLAAV